MNTQLVPLSVTLVESESVDSLVVTKMILDDIIQFVRRLAEGNDVEEYVGEAWTLSFSEGPASHSWPRILIYGLAPQLREQLFGTLASHNYPVFPTSDGDGLVLMLRPSY